MSYQTLTLIKKPSGNAKELAEYLLPHCDIKNYKKNVKLYLIYQDEPVCYLVTGGDVSIYRKEDQLLLVNLTTPSIIGLSKNAEQIINIVTISKCSLARIKRSDALKIIEEKNLWRLLSFFYMDLSEKLYLSFDMNTRLSSYEKIRIQLFELMAETETYRLNISAEQYIRDKTLLSRSGVMRILSDLRKGGYIEMERGVLLKINNIPEQY